MPELTPRQRSQISALESLADDQIDTSDVPEVLDWSNVTRGAFYSPGRKHIGRASGPSTTDTTERGLETLICEALTGRPCNPPQAGASRERPAEYGAGWICGDPADYDREHCIDLAQLSAFLHDTQPDAAESLGLDEDGPTRRRFLARLQGEITRRGTVDVLRKGVKHGPHHVDLMYGAPSPENERAAVLYGQNRFSVTRQLRYSNDNAQLALDLCLFVNGLPVATFELKNSLTKQTVDDAVEQYRRDRNPREKLFELGRCLVHFAVDDHEVKFCTHLRGKASWFLPFNKGWNDGAGNPPNPNGLKTDYLWKQVLTRDGLVDIIENYAQVVETKDDRTGHKRREQIWPRYHQLDVVRRLLDAAADRGAGPRYLVQHSAGSGKSNSIAWLAHRLIGIERRGAHVFDTVVVVTDRKVLDRQIRDTIRQFAQVGSVVGHAESSASLRALLRQGKRIVITTVQKFPYILDAIGDEHRGRRFAVIIDEAHSGQGGRASSAVSMALGEAGAEDETETAEDKINRLMESRKLLPNASYFAFTATPKNKTLEIFGAPVPEGDRTRHVPFHSYTMKQAIQEGFIIDVLAQYTPVDSYYRLVKTVEGDPEFGHQARRQEAAPLRGGPRPRHPTQGRNHGRPLPRAGGGTGERIGGQARAMVVTSSIRRAVAYYYAIRSYLAQRKSPYRALAAFSGEHDYDGDKVSEASLNGFSSNLIADRIREEPLPLPGLRRQVPDRLRRTPHAHDVRGQDTVGRQGPCRRSRASTALTPKKRDAFVLDFANDADTIQHAFADYYRTTVLAEETDPDKLHNLKAALDGYQIYDPGQVDYLVENYLSGAGRDLLDPILDVCVSAYREQLDEDAQVDFTGKAKAFLRAYEFLAAILPLHPRRVGEALHLPGLPRPQAARPGRGRPLQGHPRNHRHGQLPSGKAGRPGSPASRRGRRDRPGPHRRRRPKAGPGDGPPSPTSSRSSNDRFGNIEWKDQDKINKVISEELPAKVALNRAYQNAMANSDEQNARIEHDKGPQPRHDRPARRPHRPLQALQRQRLLPPVALRNDLRPHLPPTRQHPQPALKPRPKPSPPTPHTSQTPPNTVPKPPRKSPKTQPHSTSCPFPRRPNP